MSSPRTKVDLDGARVRIAPSPTGQLHIGTARTFLYNWLVAKKHGGEMYLRIEDTDDARSEDQYTQDILLSLAWLGLDYKDAPLSQKASLLRHKEALKELIDKGCVYRNTATANEVSVYKRDHGDNMGFRGDDQGEGAYRFRVPDEGEIFVGDLIRPNSFPARSLDDFIVARADGTPVYNFAVSVDDLDLGVNVIIRGEDHFSNTPKQALIISALGGEVPAYVHLPLLYGANGKKLSKRAKDDQGLPTAIPILELRDRGYLPIAIINYLARLGWGQDDEKILSLNELIEQFDIREVKASGAAFDEKKLRHHNGICMRGMDEETYAEELSAFSGREMDEKLARGVYAVKDKAQTLKEAKEQTNYLYEINEPTARDFSKAIKTNSKELLTEAHARLSDLKDFNDPEEIEKVLKELVEEKDVKIKELFQPIRLAVTGSLVSPYIHTTLYALEKEESLSRIQSLINKL